MDSKRVGAISESRPDVGNWNAFVISGIGRNLYGNSIAGLAIAVAIRFLDLNIHSLDPYYGKNVL